MHMPSELKQAVAKSEGQPVEVTDGPDRYVLIKAEMYERLMATLDFSELTPDDKKAQLQAMGRAAGWEEPEAAVFDDLKPS